MHTQVLFEITKGYIRKVLGKGKSYEHRCFLLTDKRRADEVLCFEKPLLFLPKTKLETSRCDVLHKRQLDGGGNLKGQCL